MKDLAPANLNMSSAALNISSISDNIAQDFSSTTANRAQYFSSTTANKAQYFSSTTANRAQYFSSTTANIVQDFSFTTPASFPSKVSVEEDPEPLVVEVESPAESAVALLAASKALLKKLTMLAVVADEDVPDSLRKLFRNINEDDGKEHGEEGIFRGQATPSPVVILTTTVQPTVSRAKNFKHKKLATYYRVDNSIEEDAAVDKNIEDDKMSLLASIRQQIISHAINDQNIIAKANNIPRYYPARKVSKVIF
jgi:hypothetical protein